MLGGDADRSDASTSSRTALEEGEVSMRDVSEAGPETASVRSASIYKMAGAIGCGAEGCRYRVQK